MNPDWGEITKALYEHSGFGDHCWYPDRSSFRNCATKTGRITEAEYERRKEMNADLFTKNETDIALLRRCIEEKWIPIYECKGNDLGDQNCPLCKRYSGCGGCPIQIDSGNVQCASTPYMDSWKEVAGIHDTADTPEKRLAALQEILYLEGLITKLTKAEEEEKEKKIAEAKAKRERARIEKERQIYHPLVYYITLKEPTVDALFRVNLQRDLTTFLRERGLKVDCVRYSFGASTHLMLNPKNGAWSHEGDVSILTK